MKKREGNRIDTANNPLYKSPFYEFFCERETEGYWYNWNGYKAATVISDEELEYFSIRSTCSLFDITPLNKYRIRGPEAEAFLNKLTVRDVSKQKIGTVKYTLWCDEDGFVIDDGTLFKLAENDFRLCSQEKHWPWLLDTSYGFNVELSDESKKICGISLQGPTAASILRSLGVKAVEQLKPFQLIDVKLGQKPVSLSRTGFTGDLGYEIFLKNEYAQTVIDKVWSHGSKYGLTAIGYTALNIARIEAGFIVANIDFMTSDHAIRPDRCKRPVDLGLDWMVDLSKEFFNGKNGILRAKTHPSNKFRLYAIEIDGKEPAEGSIVYHNKKIEVGTITSAVWSPLTKKSIAIAQLNLSLSKNSISNLWVEIYAMRELQYFKLMERISIVKPPFVNLSRRTAIPPHNS